MRLQQHIQESDMTIDMLERMKKQLDKYCQPYIKELKGVRSFLMRGMKSRDTDYFKKVAQRQDRKPRYVSSALHKMMDEWTKKHWGFKARSQASFTSPHPQTAGSYGNAYIFFPMGSFKYAWNNDVEWLYKNYDDFDFEVTLRLRKAKEMSVMTDPQEKEIQEEYFEEFIDDLEKYETTNLNKYLKKDWSSTRDYTECIVACKSYYIIHKDYEPYIARWYS